MTKISYSNLVTYAVSTLFSSVVFAGSMGGEVSSPGEAYLGVFAGGGNLISNNTINQLGTAFIPALQAPSALGVNAYGVSPNTSEWVIGGRIGYRWFSRPSNLFGKNWGFSPASELEGYYIGGATLNPTLENPNDFIYAHTFNVSLPLKTGVVLLNGVLNIDHALFTNFQPYIGFGAGIASSNISGAYSEQIDPAEVGINHYNSANYASQVGLAFQPKVGLSYKLSEHANVFVEYRFLYLTAMTYEFGNTISRGHPITTNWTVSLPAQYYNMGTAGIQFDI